MVQQRETAGRGHNVCTVCHSYIRPEKKQGREVSGYCVTSSKRGKYTAHPTYRHSNPSICFNNLYKQPEPNTVLDKQETRKLSEKNEKDQAQAPAEEAKAEAPKAKDTSKESKSILALLAKKKKWLISSDVVEAVESITSRGQARKVLRSMAENDQVKIADNPFRARQFVFGLPTWVEPTKTAGLKAKAVKA